MTLTLGWVNTTLGKIADIVSGATPTTSVAAYWGGDVQWVTPKDLSELVGAEIASTPRTLTAAGLRSCGTSLLPPNSVLLSSRAPIGHVAINTVPMSTNQGFKSLVPDPTIIDSKFLYWWLRRHRPLLESLGNGATFKEISKRVTAEIPIDVPPIEEQRRIAAVLDAADALRAKRRQTLAKLDTLTQAIFIDMFGGGDRAPTNPGRTGTKHPNGWSWVPIADVAGLGTGHTPDRAVPGYWGGDVGWVNLNEIRKHDGRWCTETEARITSEGVAHSSAMIHPTGTVCFSRTASIGFVTIMAKPMATSQDFVTWTCGDELNPDFLMHALLVSRASLRSSSSGSTHKTIYIRDAQRFRVLLPPRRLQDEFVERAACARVAVATMESEVAPLEALFASLQQRAFRGEL